MMVLFEIMSFQKPKGAGVTPNLPLEVQQNKELQPIVELMRQCVVNKPADRVTMAQVVYKLSTSSVLSH
jgi:hypothetical protein